MSKKVLVLTYWGYKEGLISNFTIPYLQLLHEVDPTMDLFLFTLNKREQQLSAEDLSNANQELAKLNTKLLAFNYNRFGLKALVQMAFLIPKLAWFIRKEKITHLHCFCTPAGAIGYLLKLFCKVTLILDSFEPHAESMVESKVWKENGLAYNILFYLEKKQTKAADYIVSLTEGMRAYSQEKYGISIKNFDVKPSCINTSKFDNPDFIKNGPFLQKLKLEDKIIGLYAGKFGGLYLEEETFDLIKTAYNQWGTQFQMLILGNNSYEYIQEKARSKSIPLDIITKIFATEKELPYYFGAADFALTPVKPIPSKRYCSPIKNGEYWLIGLPVIITKNISDDSDIIHSENIGYVLQNLCAEEYQNAIDWVDRFLKSENKEAVKNDIRALGVELRSMDRAKAIYKKIYTS